MELVVVTTVRLLGEGLSASLERRNGFRIRAVCPSLSRLLPLLSDGHVNLVLIDVTQGIDLEEVRTIALQFPNLPLLAFGLNEQRHDVIRCGRAGFSGYVARDADVNSLCSAMLDVVAGRVACPAEISGGLLRALFRGGQVSEIGLGDSPLTRRERDVLEHVGQGLTNKEIARELSLSVATVKHHVHSILEKLKLSRRSEIMRGIPGMPIIGGAGPAQRRKGAD